LLMSNSYPKPARFFYQTLGSVGVAGNNSYYSLQPLSSLNYVSSDNNEMVSKLLELDKS